MKWLPGFSAFTSLRGLANCIRLSCTANKTAESEFINDEIPTTTSVADPEPGSGVFLAPRFGIQIRNLFYPGSGMEKLGSGMEKFGFVINIPDTQRSQQGWSCGKVAHQMTLQQSTFS